MEPSLGFSWVLALAKEQQGNPGEILNPLQNPICVDMDGTQKSMRPGDESHMQEASASADQVYQVIPLSWASVFSPVKWEELVGIDNM